MLFEVNDLNIEFDTLYGELYAVRGVSFNLKEKEILGIVGESGSGKSVTALSLMRILPDNGIIKSGDIKYKGESILDFDKKRLNNFRGKSVSMIFQEPGKSFDPIYTIGKSLAESIITHDENLSKQEVHEKSIKLLNEVKIPNAEERLSNFPHQFSGGLLQRIMIATALSSNPEVLIADEPTTSLDVTIQAEIINILLQLKESRNLSIVFISHNLALVENISDRIIVMYAGLIMEEGPAKDIVKNPYHPYTKALLESHPDFGSHYSKDDLQTIPGSIPDPKKPEKGCPFAPRCSYVKNECREKIPEIINDNHNYRCIIKGVKK